MSERNSALEIQRDAANLLRDEDGVTWSRFGLNDDGAIIWSRLTRDQKLDDCTLCAAGTCWQRVERCDSWGCDHIVHGEGCGRGRGRDRPSALLTVGGEFGP